MILGQVDVSRADLCGLMSQESTNAGAFSMHVRPPDISKLFVTQVVHAPLTHFEAVKGEKVRAKLDKFGEAEIDQNGAKLPAGKHETVDLGQVASASVRANIASRHRTA